MTVETPHMPLDAVEKNALAVEGLPDEVLARRLNSGEASAGDTLVRRYHQPLLRYLQRLVGSGQLAEEVLQATWLSVLEHLGKFDPSSMRGGFRAWLFRIATNKVNDVWRARGRERLVREGLRLIVDDQSPPPACNFEGTEQQQKLLGAIRQLPENQRQVLLLRYYGGMRFVEIAEMLGCPLNTALGRMHKAMQRLKQLMEE